MLPVISQADLNEITFDVFSTHRSAVPLLDGPPCQAAAL